MTTFEIHKHWSAVKEVYSCLKRSGHIAVLAGGCVRDLIMQREPNDFDIATSALPDQVATLFPHSLEVGRAFGINIIPYSDFQIEVATFREDLGYSDGRHPEGIKFSTLEEDAKRRDFTVNALFFDIDSKKIIDLVGGEQDIKNKIIRAVGVPEERFSEDKLRLFRAIRFATQLKFSIEKETFLAIQKKSSEISVVSRERVRDELFKLLKSSERVHGLELLETSGLLASTFPSLFTAVLRNGQTWIKSFAALPNSCDDLVVLIALFFQPCFELAMSSEGTKSAALDSIRNHQLKSLRLDSHLINSIIFIYNNQEKFMAPEVVRRGEMALLCAHPAALSAEVVITALERVSDMPIENFHERQSYMNDLRAHTLNKNGQKPEPLVNGKDAKNCGIMPGPQMGRILNEAYLLQLEGRFLDRAEALAWLKLGEQ
jgi:tRNA nucleotidyltransferase/poly(A) polymerase